MQDRARWGVCVRRAAYRVGGVRAVDETQLCGWFKCVCVVSGVFADWANDYYASILAVQTEREQAYTAFGALGERFHRF